MIIRFLQSGEYAKTKELAEECFGKSQDNDQYYAKDVCDGRVAVLESDGNIVSMAHIRPMIAQYDDGERLVWYILYVCTAVKNRGCGYMKSVINFVTDTLEKEGAGLVFLVPVDRKVYEKLGFIHEWSFGEDETELLYADDGLTLCTAKELGEEKFRTPIKLRRAATVEDFKYTDFNADEACRYFEYFYIRPNKSFDSVPTDCCIFSDVFETKCGILDGRCFIMTDTDDDGIPEGCIPFCRENELVHYFKLQEKYFNEVLGVPFRAHLADAEGVMYLKNAGVLENYDITEDEEIFDYIYSGEELRTLSGRKFSKKRNHINKFESLYGEKWEYRTLGYENADEIIAFLKKWESKRAVDEIDVDYGKSFESGETLDIELRGTEKLLKNKGFMKKVRAGGIYIDGVLCAFSLGAYNPLEKMAVIDIEKAFSEYEGLYQLINREFLVHEFPDAQTVNREDDVGLPGLRKSKMSYNPVSFEKRFYIMQKNEGMQV